MQTFNGGSVTNLLKNINNDSIYITDTFQRAVRYANAQATGTVNPDMNQELAENAMVLEIEASPHWKRRPDKHTSLDTCEDVVKSFSIIKATIRFAEYENTLYGTRQTGYKNREEVIEFLYQQRIEVEVL
jgi:hypothetical protein